MQFGFHIHKILFFGSGQFGQETEYSPLIHTVCVACVGCDGVQFYNYLEFQLSTFDMKFK